MSLKNGFFKNITRITLMTEISFSLLGYWTKKNPPYHSKTNTKEKYTPKAIRISAISTLEFRKNPKMNFYFQLCLSVLFPVLKHMKRNSNHKIELN